MFRRRGDESFAIVGTTRPIYVPRDAGAGAVRPGQDYYLIQVHDAQSAFTGRIWEQVKRLVVTSQVNLHHPLLGHEAVHAIQRSRAVSKDRAVQLGLSPNLVSLVPATMTHVSVSIEFIVDKENRLVDLVGLINDDTFLSAVSLAPGSALVAKTVGSLAHKVIQSFIPAEERAPILQFAGDFNLDERGLQDGYYVILGSTDDGNPIPDPLPELEVVPGGLLAGGERITQLSYVILDVRRSPARTRERNENAPWEAKLREAEATADMLAGDPLAADDEKARAWDKCKRLISEARALLAADSNYLPREADSIWKGVYKRCADALFGLEEEAVPGTGFQDEDLVATVDAYAERVAEAQQVLDGVVV
jgi:hypothetical protein